VTSFETPPNIFIRQCFALNVGQIGGLTPHEFANSIFLIARIYLQKRDAPKSRAGYSDKSRRPGLRDGSLDKKPNTNKPTKKLTTMYTRTFRVNILASPTDLEQLRVFAIELRQPFYNI
jgi:hypothetical protein